MQNGTFSRDVALNMSVVLKVSTGKSARIFMETPIIRSRKGCTNRLLIKSIGNDDVKEPKSCPIISFEPKTRETET